MSDWRDSPFKYSEEEPQSDDERSDKGEGGRWYKGRGRARVVRAVHGSSTVSFEEALRAASALARAEGIVDAGVELEVVRTQVVGSNPPISEHKVWVLPGPSG